ncbi:MAG TPA: serine hydrolase [Gemmatimonadales bacterium]|nr:serine hydrolase [Gemmatimonadales bacterium]
MRHSTLLGPAIHLIRPIRLAGVLIGTPLMAQAWPTATPASVGINGAVLDSIDREIKAGTYNSIDRFVVIRNGKLVFDRHYAWNYDSIYGDSSKTRNPLNAHDPTGSYNYFNPWWHPTYRRGDLHSLQSVTKTVTSVIIGVARTRGDFPSIDTPVLRFFDTTQVKNIDDRKRRMTVRHLLTMSGGIDWNESLPYIDPGNTAVAMEASFDWVDYTINRPMAVEPGSRWLYSSGETELLAHIFRKATGMDIEEYGAKYLFAPLGIERWYWKRIPTGLVDTEGGLYLEAKDLARIWNLWLQNGKVGGKQLISPEWIAESVKPALRVGPNPGAPSYGFKWWLYQNPTDTTRFMWGGSGFGGQLPVAIPEKDMVVVFNGWNILPGRGGIPLARTMERILRASK